MTMRMGGEWNMENAVPAAVTGDGQDADELFRSLGCDYIQGYYYSKARPGGGIRALCDQLRRPVGPIKKQQAAARF